MENYALAEADARKATALDPGNVRGHSHLGNALRNQGNYVDANKSFQRCARLGSTACQGYFDERAQDWQGDVCLDWGYFSFNKDDGAQWLVTQISIEDYPTIVESISAFLMPYPLDATPEWQCDAAAPLEAGLLVHDKSSPPDKLAFYEQWQVTAPSADSIATHVENRLPIRVESTLSQPLTVTDGQHLFAAYRRAPSSLGATCVPACVEGYAVNDGWFATGETEPLNWEPISDTILGNLAVCVNPGCTWP
jgi:hypothetical protein